MRVVRVRCLGHNTYGHALGLVLCPLYELRNLTGGGTCVQEDSHNQTVQTEYLKGTRIKVLLDRQSSLENFHIFQNHKLGQMSRKINKFNFPSAYSGFNGNKEVNISKFSFLPLKPEQTNGNFYKKQHRQYLIKTISYSYLSKNKDEDHTDV